MSSSRRKFIKVVGATGIGGLAGCTGGGGGDTPEPTDTPGGGGTATPTEGDGMQESVKGAFVVNDPLGDQGWVDGHNEHRLKVDAEFDWYQTELLADVDVSQAASTFADFAEQGFDIVEGATFGYGEPAAQTAPDYEDTFFEVTRLSQVDYDGPNLGYYYAKLYQVRFLSGIAAGMLTESNTLGYVTAFPISLLISDINAMMIGARMVNPNATMKIRYVNTWYDPAKEKEAASSLIDEGADVIAYHQSDPAPLQAANDNDAWGIGYAGRLRQFGGDNYVTSVLWNWRPLYAATAKAAREGTLFDASRFDFPDRRLNYMGLERGGVALDSWGPNVPQEVQDEVASVQDEIVEGSLKVFDGTPWEGMDILDIKTGTGSYAEGIEGEVPS